MARLNPRVDISVKTALSLIPNPGEAIGMLVGTAQYGPINEVLTFGDLTSVLETFQEDRNENTTITKAAEIFFANGGGVLKVLRVASGDAANATLQLAGAGSTANVITIDAKYKGVYGNQFMVDIDTQGSGRIARVKIGDIIELFDNNGASNGYESNADLVAALNTSRFITATSNSVNLVDSTVTFTQLSGGNDGSTVLTNATYTTAFDDLISNDDWDFLIIPNSKQTSSVEDNDAFHTAILAKIENRAAQYKKYSIFVSGASLNETIATTQARTTTGERFVLCSPGIQHVSRVTGNIENLDGTYFACCVAGQACNLDETGQSITRKNIVATDLIVDTTTNKKYYTNIEIEQLLSARTVVGSKISNALKYARGVTRAASITNIYFELSVLRIVDRIRMIIQDTLDDYLGEPNSTITRERMAAVVNGILENSKNQGVLDSYNPTVVTQGISPDSTNVAISIKPIFATNFIDVVINVN